MLVKAYSSTAVGKRGWRLGALERCSLLRAYSCLLRHLYWPKSLPYAVKSLIRAVRL
jgi:hypothetical protein